MSITEPICLGADYTNKFFEPQISSIAIQNVFHIQDNVQIAWFGGKGNSTPVQPASLSLYLHGSKEHITIVGKQSRNDLKHKSWEILDYRQC